MNARLRAWRLLAKVLFSEEQRGTERTVERELSAAAAPWNEIVSLANTELVTATLWNALQRRGLAGFLPADLRTYAESFHELTAARNDAIALQLLECIHALHSRGIRSMPIKGAAYLLSELDVGGRFMIDVDLLVPPDDAGRAQAILIGQGYQPFTPENFAALNHRHMLPLAREGLPAVVELHTAAVPQRLEAALPARRLWANAVNAANGAYCLPSPTDTAAISFFHAELIDIGTSAFLLPLRTFHDLHVLDSRFGGDIAWRDVLAAASGARAAKRFRRYAHAYSMLSGKALVPELRFLPTDSASFATCEAAIAWPAVMHWGLRIERLSERSLRKDYGLTGGSLEVNRYRLKRAIEMIGRSLRG